VWRARFARWSNVTQPAIAFTSTSPIHVASIVASSIGWILAATSADSVLVFFLDESGALTAPVHRYLGADAAFSLASSSSDSTFAIGAHRPSGEPEVRVLDATGNPTSPWVCLAGPSNGAVGVDSDPAGYAAVFTTETGNAAFARIDETGAAQ
jgi:hypothetical protein